MAYCVKCGARVDDGQSFCPYCGAEIPKAAQDMNSSSGGFGGSENYTYYQNSYQDPYQDSQSRPDYFPAAEVKKNKLMGVLSYLGILILVPLLAGDKSSAYVRHHANQGIILFVISSVLDLLDGKWVWGFHSWINFGGGALSWLIEIADFACLILFIMGLVSACQGTRRELPLIGKIKVLK